VLVVITKNIQQGEELLIDYGPDYIATDMQPPKEAEHPQNDNNNNNNGPWDPVECLQVFKEKSIGKGSFGTVYLGKYFDSVVAVKCFESKNGDKVKKEWNTLNNIRHPKIISAFAFGTYKTQLVMVMEYARHGDLEVYLKENWAALHDNSLLYQTFVRKIATDISSAMELLHSRSIVHRDLKPGNILMFEATCTQELPIIAKVTDCGVAKEVEQDTQHTVVGTLGWMAPEQHSGKYNKLVDVYSFGLIILHLLQPRIPGKDHTQRPDADKVNQLSHPFHTWKQLLSDCLKVNPKKRPEFSEISQRLWSL